MCGSPNFGSFGIIYREGWHHGATLPATTCARRPMNWSGSRFISERAFLITFLIQIRHQLFDCLHHRRRRAVKVIDQAFEMFRRPVRHVELHLIRLGE